MVIHILQYGVALCPDAAKIFVKDWPKEWKWTAVSTAYDPENPLEQRCPDCYIALEADPKLAAAAAPEKSHGST